MEIQANANHRGLFDSVGEEEHDEFITMRRGRDYDHAQVAHTTEQTALQKEFSDSNKRQYQRQHALEVNTHDLPLPFFESATTSPDDSSCPPSLSASTDLLSSTTPSFESNPSIPQNDETPRTPRSPRVVHFRQRVRITSGLGGRHRSRRSTSSVDFTTLTEQQKVANLVGSPQSSSTLNGESSQTITIAFSPDSSSTPSSRSSSISVPLRTTEDDESNPPSWGPLGRRVSLLSSERNEKRALRDKRRKRIAAIMAKRADEFTPLNPNGSTYDSIRAYDSDEDECLRRETDDIFGTFPGRLFNRHWWWWQLEPHLSCTCFQSDDADEY